MSHLIIFLIYPGLRQPVYYRQLNKSPTRSPTSGSHKLQADHDRDLRQQDLRALHRLLHLHQLLQHQRVSGGKDQLHRERLPAEEPDQVWDRPRVPVSPSSGVLPGRNWVNCLESEHQLRVEQLLEPRGHFSAMCL